MDFLDCFDFEKPLSLYVHIPFCTKKCSYCAFYSGPCDSLTKKSYVAKLVREIEQVTQRMNRPFFTAYVGGGNPGCIEPSDLKRIAAAVCAKGRTEEFTVEMNPESLCTEHFELFEKYFTRLSMGVQSFDEKALKFLGRNANLEKTSYGVSLAKHLKEKTGCQLNLDLITCLGDFHDYMKDASTMVENVFPDHISLYSLTLEENTPLFNKNPVLPDSDRQYEILKELWNYLERSGYNHYEVSNFAKKGKESKHNKTYWNYRQYMGLGSSAASRGFKYGNYTAVQGISDFVDYCETDLFSTYEFQNLSKNEALDEFVLMGMRCTDGLDLIRLKEEFGKTVDSVPYGYSVVSDRLIPSDEGLMTADSAALDVDSAF